MWRDFSSMADRVIWFALALFVAHELDAVARHEWRLLPGFAHIEDNIARDLFVLIHVPVFFIVFWIMTHRDAGVKRAGQLAVAGLIVIHGGAHFLLSNHVAYEFKGIVAHLTIYGATLAGASHLLLRTLDAR